MEAAFATETSVLYGNNTTQLFKMLCWCFCSHQPRGAGGSQAELFGCVTVIAFQTLENAIAWHQMRDFYGCTCFVLL